MVTRRLLFVSILLISLMLMPAGAHLLALPNKIGMTAADYFVAQQAYRGWSYTGVLVLGGIAATAVLAWRVRHSRTMYPPTLAALICLLATQFIFWAVVFPGNQATQNWTTVPVNWDSLRMRWEFGHALSALLTIAALVSLLVTFSRGDPMPPRNSGQRIAIPA